MDNALMRVPIVIANSIGIYISYNPPASADDSKELDKYKNRKETKDLLTSIAWAVVPLLRLINLTLGFSEAYMIVTSVYPALQVSYIHSILVPSSAKAPAPSDYYMSVPFIVSSIFIFIGSFLRVWCFRTLGRHFTFELTFRKDHKLVTDGPYSVVRHPSYLAAVMVVIGMIVAQLFSPGSWYVESRLWGTQEGRTFGIFWIAYGSWAAAMLLSRVSKEDLLLRSEFKDQWTAWSKQTRYAVIPYIW